MEIPDLLKILRKWSTRPDLKILSGKYDVEEIGDGNLNDVWRVRSQKDRDNSVIVKHSPPFIKCIGPNFPLTVDRISIEYHALQKFHEIKSDCVPKPFVLDDIHNLVIMEDLQDYKIMRKCLIAGEFDLSWATAIAHSAAIIHRNTHVKSLTESDFGELVTNFRNDDMVSLTKDFVFTNPFMTHHPTNRCSDDVKQQLHRVLDDKDVQMNAAKMTDKFTNVKQCLLHGDLHTGSIMVHENLAKMMDLEFACVGPAAFDIGMLIANYIFSYHSHKYYPLIEDSKLYTKLQTATEMTVSVYLNTLDKYLTEEDTSNIISDIAGFAGCELLRRIIGTAHVEDLEGRPQAEVACLHTGIKLLKHYSTIRDVQKLLDCIFLQ